MSVSICLILVKEEHTYYGRLLSTSVGPWRRLKWSESNISINSTPSRILTREEAHMWVLHEIRSHIEHSLPMLSGQQSHKLMSREVGYARMQESLPQTRVDMKMDTRMILRANKLGPVQSLNFTKGPWQPWKDAINIWGPSHCRTASETTNAKNSIIVMTIGESVKNW
jgi:hypothetical protein